MEILHKIRQISILLLFIVLMSCKNDVKVKIESNNNEILKDLPDDIANKTWIPYHKEDSYKDLVNKIEFPVTLYVKTSKTSFYKLDGEMELQLYELPSKKMVKSVEKYTMYLEAPYLDHVSLSWVNKKRGIIDIEYVYKTPLPIDVKDSIFKISYVDKSFIRSENFPEKKELEIVLERKKSEDLDKYESIESSPIIGEFSCDITELRKSITFKSIKSDLYDSESKVIETQPFKVVVSLDEIRFVYVDLVCSLRKVIGSSNKYMFFFNHTENAEDVPDNIIHHSENHPIGEMEVLDDKSIKFKWFGLYSLKTQKYQGYGDYSWKDTCNNVLTKIEE